MGDFNFPPELVIGGKGLKELRIGQDAVFFNLTKQCQGARVSGVGRLAGVQLNSRQQSCRKDTVVINPDICPVIFQCQFQEQILRKGNLM